MIRLSRKFFLLVLLSSLLIFPLQSRATDWFYAVKEFGVDLAARAIARAAFQNLSQGLVEQIQGKGRDGGPAFVTNWRNFQTDAQYRGEDIFRAMLASTKLCGYIDDEIKSVFNAKTKIPLSGINTRVGSLESFGSRVSCTLPQGFDLANYQKDFKGNGGWQVFSRLSEPQNNYYGVLLESLSELGKQSAIEESADLNEALANDGYTSVRKGRAPNDSCQGRGANAKCVVLGNIVTPGKLLGETVANTIDQDLNWIATSDEISEVMIAVISATVDRLVNLAESSTTAPDPKIEKEQSLKEEYCTAKFPSDEALDKYGKTKGFESKYDRAAVRKSGYKGPCEGVRDKYGADNPYPYQRCILACFKAVGAIPESVSVPSVTPEVTPNEEPGGGSGGPTSSPSTTATPISTTSPTSSPSTSAPTSLLSDIQAERLKYGTPMTPAEIGKLLNTVAWNNRGNGWVLLGKPSGTNCPMPNGVLISCDFLVHRPTIKGYDVLGDIEGPANPTWSGPDPNIPGLVASGQRTLVDPIQP